MYIYIYIAAIYKQPLSRPSPRATPKLMEAMPEFVEQPLTARNHYGPVVSGSVRNLFAIYPKVFAKIFRAGAFARIISTVRALLYQFTII